MRYNQTDPLHRDLSSFPKSKHAEPPCRHYGGPMPVKYGQPISVWYQPPDQEGWWIAFAKPENNDWTVPCVYRVRHPQKSWQETQKNTAPEDVLLRIAGALDRIAMARIADALERIATTYERDSFRRAVTGSHLVDNIGQPSGERK